MVSRIWRRVYEHIAIGSDVTVTVLRVEDQKVLLGVIVPKELTIQRGEDCRSERGEDREASDLLSEK